MEGLDLTLFSDVPLTAVIAFFLYRTLRDVGEKGDRIIDLLQDCLDAKGKGDSPDQ